jgi:hypothetical protein
MRCVICSKISVPAYELFELDLVAVAERPGTEDLEYDSRRLRVGICKAHIYLVEHLDLFQRVCLLGIASSRPEAAVEHIPRGSSQASRLLHESIR